ncbi:hypothetical protein Asppvi_001464 [Aspergillus pseudoviridinutans]|uniref:Uncharacterized protein n=1 Tax=Aspergillus pseudoviridinutans TaxID=1517512 RepID=A0A9P3B243_9EURO|nr:uncharacterized protein Asppvi_001464 [Aspergillus pseudoviridinutans]GIJ82947.1 hypothetical protein Asppvi_001464 [Aspergillus pseudoviridinutans]
MAPKPTPKPKAKPSKRSPHPTPRQEKEKETEPPCEFTHPCTTSTSPSGNANASGKGGTHPRKLISHIFGRNKTATKLFPSHVWVHYCRKHYQRARYRARAWPFTQCDLLLDSLARMEAWGGVESFEVVLRRREVVRVSSSSSSSSLQQSGTKERVGEGEGVDGLGLKRARRNTTSASTSAYVSGDDEEEHGDAEEEESSDDGRKRRQRRKPRIKACPVPEWLRAETGPGKSFAEIRAIVERIRADLTEQHQRCQMQKTNTKSQEQVLFPDIEILPTFREWVLEQANEDGEGTRKMSRVSRKGAVQKAQR